MYIFIRRGVYSAVFLVECLWERNGIEKIVRLTVKEIRSVASVYLDCILHVVIRIYVICVHRG